MYLEKARAGENIAFEDYVRWQLWTVGPLSKTVEGVSCPSEGEG